MKPLVFLTAALAFVGVANAGPVPAGWKVIKDNNIGKCQMAVPLDWKVDEIMGKPLGAARSPDGKVDAVVSIMDGMPFAQFKQTVWMVYQKEKSAPKIEESNSRLWFEITSMGKKEQTKWYVGTPSGAANSCNAQVNFTKGDKKGEELARKIVETIGGG